MWERQRENSRCQRVNALALHGRCYWTLLSYGGYSYQRRHSVTELLYCSGHMGWRSITGTWRWDLAAPRAPIYCPALSQYSSLFRPSIITIPPCLCSWNTVSFQNYVTSSELKACHKLQTVLAEYLLKGENSIVPTPIRSVNRQTLKWAALICHGIWRKLSNCDFT